MQCLLSWNNLEKTWDCACHGSRFAAEGRLLHGPAKTDLPSRPLP
jgi:Rieske Fe-S protein